MLLAHQGYQSEAAEAFKQSIRDADDLLSKVPNKYSAKYVAGRAAAGLVLLAEEDGQQGQIEQALERYQAAYKNCSAPGIVLDELTHLDKLNLLASIYTLLNNTPYAV